LPVRSFAVPQVLIAAIALMLLAPVRAALAADEPLAASPGDYALDERAARLDIELSPRVAGFPTTVLHLTKLKGRFRYDPGQSEVTVSADPRSIQTSGGLVGRRAKALFEPEKFPTIQFTSTSLRRLGGDRGEAVGELTFHGVTRPLVLTAVLKDTSHDGAGPQERLRFAGRGRLKRSDFGVKDSLFFISDNVDLVFDLEFAKQPASDAPP
jgi:polyisoprenoid-binding protein YceI